MESMQTAMERRLEANDICSRLAGAGISSGSMIELQFFSKIRDPWVEVSPAQLQWLRDLEEQFIGGI